MLPSSLRLLVLKRHINLHRKTCFGKGDNGFSMTVAPSVGMIDEKVRILLCGLDAKQIVTLIADVTENGMKFESRCVYQADTNGNVDNFTDESIGGSFVGIEPMGLFWSLKCISGPQRSARLVKKDVCTPMIFDIRVFAGTQTGSNISVPPLVLTRLQRLYKHPGVRRIPLTGRFKGTIFLPEGDGPFPGLIDMFGGIVSLIETRAALLASHGYATMALSYLYGEGLPQMLMSTDFSYIKEACEWFMEQDFIDKSRLGAVGLCFGGFLSLALASVLPQIRGVVNVNGVTVTAEENCIVCESPAWLKKEKVYNTDEGIVIADVYDCDNPRTAWQHGAKILVIVGEDDKQVHPKWHTFFYEQCPSQFKQNIHIHRYPGAGHMIEPPYSPHSRVVTPGRKRMKSINFISEKFYDADMVVGGWPDKHAFAQEDSWNKILTFLEQNVKNPS
ncbi:bile acid-CoA:amino acid N-acyltransferase-like [Mercenaria mercenaria]|uniref:bile acid-CoA:amino acid N-acyltransferase-like n=1 Tax=Mercenaria mercenaria TaxID=6596 RepID=UPI00234EE28B|nr:bile acid-CoA:amino acid N-acyltransferase-like [Mercenaria mercenaria]